MRPNQLKFASGKPGQNLPLRPDDLAQVQHFLLDLKNLVESFLGRILQGLTFQLCDLQGKFLEGRFVVFHD